MKSKFLQRPVPYKYESLDSYLIRLAEANLLRVDYVLKEFNLYSNSSINAYYMPSPKFYSISPSTIEHISNMTGLDRQTIQNMTPKGFLSKKDIYNSAKFCPLCLKEHNYPRIHWQFPLIQICIEHNSLLLTRCPNCNTCIGNDTIINGICRCGKIVKNIKPLICQNKELLNFNKTLYEVYGIIDVAHNTSHFGTFTNEEYLGLIKCLLEFFDDNIDIISQIRILNLFDYMDYPHLYSYQILCKVLNNWPKQLFLLFDCVCKISHGNMKDIQNICIKKVFSPITNSALFRNSEIFDYMTKIFFQYFISKCDYECFVKKFRQELIEEKFLRITIFNDLFGIRPCIYKIYNFPEIRGDFINIIDIYNYET